MKKSYTPAPSIDKMVAGSFNSAHLQPVTNSVPALADRARWKGSVATFACSANCCAMVRCHQSSEEISHHQLASGRRSSCQIKLHTTTGPDDVCNSPQPLRRRFRRTLDEESAPSRVVPRIMPRGRPQFWARAGHCAAHTFVAELDYLG